MSEDNGSAEQQAERIRERATGTSGTSLSKRRRERYGGEGAEESAAAWLRRAGQRLLERPGGPWIAGLALIAGSAAVVGARETRERRGWRALRRFVRSARESLEGFREERRDARPPGIAALTGLAALALAGVMWTRIDRIERPRRPADRP